ncbi:hypothetical protein L1887_13786 [Cichorium endivia]|nr:hypothetical protein L1887_13786 [Cichorium endivia]
MLLWVHKKKKRTEEFRQKHKGEGKEEPLLISIFDFVNPWQGSNQERRQSEKVLYELEPIDQQLAVTFSHDGSLLAVGREYRMGVADVRDGHDEVSRAQLNFPSHWAGVLRPCLQGTVECRYQMENICFFIKRNDEVSGFCKFSHDALNNEVLYVTAMRDRGSYFLQKQIVKEGQVICYVDQLGGDLPIESDVGGQVIKILRDDCEPVGHGDALIAILPSFPGIKKLQ